MIPLFNRQSVDMTSELARIMAMPRRTWTDKDLQELADRMTALLKTPGGTEKLRPIQALALHEIYVSGGLVALVKVGGGKTLLSLLAAYMVQAVRPMLLLPACLIGKTEKEAKRLRKHWRIPTNIQMLSYEMLGREQSANALDNWKPDLIIGDEIHKLKNRKVGRTRRVARYMRDYPDTMFVAMSGTFMKHSIKDFAHIIRWCLKDKAPIPRTDGEVSEWADCLDVKVPALARRGAGALLQLALPLERQTLPPLQAARIGFQRRLTETAGVVTSAGEGVSCTLYIRALPYELGPHMEAHFDKLRNNMETPDGWELTMSTEVFMHSQQLALGFFSVWDPRPPNPWRLSRKLWAKFVRDQLADSDHLDTEKQVKGACARGELPDLEYQDWIKVEPTFEIHTKDRWVDDAALDVIVKWMSEGPGIVWCAHVFLAEELVRRTGAQYFRQDGRDKNGVPVEEADCSKVILVSYASCKEGRNLQGDASRNWPGFSRNLVTALPGGADDVEQMIGRTHRDGQLADEVTVDFLLGCQEHWSAWTGALAGAIAARDTLGQTQKILLADVIVPTQAEMDREQGSRWRKK